MNAVDGRDTHDNLNNLETILVDIIHLVEVIPSHSEHILEVIPRHSQQDAFFSRRETGNRF